MSEELEGSLVYRVSSNLQSETLSQKKKSILEVAGVEPVIKAFQREGRKVKLKVSLQNTAHYRPALSI